MLNFIIYHELEALLCADIYINEEEGILNLLRKIIAWRSGRRGFTPPTVVVLVCRRSRRCCRNRKINLHSKESPLGAVRNVSIWQGLQKRWTTGYSKLWKASFASIYPRATRGRPQLSSLWLVSLYLDDEAFYEEEDDGMKVKKGEIVRIFILTWFLHSPSLLINIQRRHSLSFGHLWRLIVSEFKSVSSFMNSWSLSKEIN